MLTYVRTHLGAAMPVGFSSPRKKSELTLESSLKNKQTTPEKSASQTQPAATQEVQSKITIAPSQAHHFSGAMLNTKKTVPIRFQGWGQTGQALPEVNLQDFTSGNAAKRVAFVQKLGNSLSQFGFVSISGHNVSPTLIKTYYQTLPKVFGLPMDVKKQYVRADLGRSRGYYELGQETKSAYEGGPRVADKKENWHSGAPDTLNVFPQEGSRSFPRQNERLFKQMENTSLLLAEAVGEYLDSIGLKDQGYLKSTLLDGKRPIGNHLMRSIHYPAVPEAERQGYQAGQPVIRAGQHFDMNLFTLLPEATEAGLQIMPRKNGQETGKWLPIHSQAGTLVMNVGDMLSLISGGEINEQGRIVKQGVIPSIRHQVVGDETTLSRPRLSIPFFTTPHYDKPLRNLKTGQEIPTVAFSYRRLNGHGSLNNTSLSEFRKNVTPMVRPLTLIR
ncbi:2-oxoglutarate and iron-dependent oxygenase domain-containing protein [Vampirovibrio sp.]|uniref:2-oxoglutarate and iron-dependent oxygenase domain-containing protein n=1 Tax=Vampirovibrio sp. TaxID=2717857 RepID=UPI0035941892